MEAPLERPLLPRSYEAENSVCWPAVPNSDLVEQPQKSLVRSSDGPAIATKDECLQIKQAAQQPKAVSKSIPKQEPSFIATTISLKEIASLPSPSQIPSSLPKSTSKSIFSSTRDSASLKSQEESSKSQVVEPRRWLQTKIARFGTSKSQWPNPGLSIGIKCNRMGGYECWEAIGPAKILFDQISAKIGDLLEARLDELEEGEPLAENIIMFGMYMMGKLPETARPTLVFSCQSQKPRRRAIKFLKESAILKSQPKIALAESSIAPVILAGYGVKRTPTGEFDGQGLPVICLSSGKRATIGGYVLVDGHCYGMTVAHVFTDPSCHSEALEIADSTEEVENTIEALDDDREFAFDVDSDQNEDSDAENVADTSRASMSSVASLSRSGTINTRSSIFWSDSQSLQNNTDVTDLQNLISRDNPSGIESTDPSSHTPFAWLHTTSASKIQLGIDWALVKCSTSGSQIQLSAPPQIPPKDVTSPTRFVPILENSAAVIALKGYSGISSGTISPSTSMMRLPQSRSFQEVWTVRLDGALVEGDSGSWVVDAASGDLYGHIVAGLKDKNIAYIVPAYKVFEDITRVLGGVSFLPSKPGSDNPPSYRDDTVSIPEASNNHEDNPSSEILRNEATQAEFNSQRELKPTFSKPEPSSRVSKSQITSKSPARNVSSESLKSLYENSDVDSGMDGDIYINQLLALQSFHTTDLLRHIQTYPFQDSSRIIVLPVLTRVQTKTQLPQYWQFVQSLDDSTAGGNPAPHFAIAIVERSGKSNKHNYSGHNRLEELWYAMQGMEDQMQFAVGRLLIIREPSPMMFMILHHMLNASFDMDEIFEALVQQELSSLTVRSFSTDERSRRSFVFPLNYYTIIGDGCVPFPWQDADHSNDTSWTAPRLTKCSSIVALCLMGDAVRKLRPKFGRSHPERTHGLIYDIWSPWQVLNIQCFADHKYHSHDANYRYLNGPDAFLLTLLTEYQNCEKRFRNIYNQITKVVRPANKSQIDVGVQQCFWAYQTLGIVNASVRALLDEFQHTFTDDFWEGKDNALWPILEDSNLFRRTWQWKKQLISLKKSFHAVTDRLEKMIELSNTSRKDIKDLREHFFHLASISQGQHHALGQISKDSRDSKLLTMTTMFFLPLVLITSIFSLPFESRYFNLVFISLFLVVCFFLMFLIWLLNSKGGARAWEFMKWRLNTFYRFKSKTMRQAQSSIDFDYELESSRGLGIPTSQDGYSAMNDDQENDILPTKVERSNVQFEREDLHDIEGLTTNPWRRKKWFKPSGSSST